MDNDVRITKDNTIDYINGLLERYKNDHAAYAGLLAILEHVKLDRITPEQGHDFAHDGVKHHEEHLKKLTNGSVAYAGTSYSNSLHPFYGEAVVASVSTGPLKKELFAEAYGKIINRHITGGTTMKSFINVKKLAAQQVESSTDVLDHLDEHIMPGTAQDLTLDKSAAIHPYLTRMAGRTTKEVMSVMKSTMRQVGKSLKEIRAMLKEGQLKDTVAPIDTMIGALQYCKGIVSSPMEEPKEKKESSTEDKSAIKDVEQEVTKAADTADDAEGFKSESL